MKFVILLVFISIGIFIIMLVSNKPSSSDNVTVTGYAADGLDLKAVTDTATKAKNAEDFEKKLNAPGNKINNLDLDEDNKVDYIKVTETTEGKARGFSLSVKLGPDQEQEVCTIQIEKDGSDHAKVQTHGNSNIYGHNHYYYHRSPISEMIMWHYLMSNRGSNYRPYRSRYGHNNYPSNFSPSKPISKAEYSGFHESKPYAQAIQKTNTSQTAHNLSPNKNKTASNIKAPLRNPSSSQKSFQRSNPSRSFSSSSSRSSVRMGSSSSSRSRSSFGGGK